MAEAPETGGGDAQADRKSARDSAKEWLRRLEPGRRQRSGLITAAVVLAVVAAIGYQTWPKWKRHIEGLIPDRQIADTSEPAETDNQAAGESALPDRGGTTEPPATAPPAGNAVARRADERLSSIAARLDLIVERIGRLEAKASRPPPIDTELHARLDGLGTSIAAMDKRLGEAEQTLAALQEASRTRRADALALAVGHLRESLSRGAPYGEALAGLRSVGGRDAKIRTAIESLSANAEKGVPSLAALQARFDAAAAASARAALAPEKSGWFNRTVARLSGTVTIRRTGGDVRGDTPGAIVARAEAMVRRGELEPAVRQLDALKGAPARAMADWLNDARARVAADRALASLTQIAIARIAAAQKSAGGG